MRKVVRETGHGRPGLVGGAYGGRAGLAARRWAADAKLIVPLALGLVFLIVAVLLRSLIAPLYVIATVLMSWAFALGASLSLLFTHVFGQPDSDPAQPLFTFVFLVALGVDYNVFLITRIREARAHGRTIATR